MSSNVNVTEIQVGFSPIIFGNCFRPSTLELGKNLVKDDHVSHVKEVIRTGQPRMIEGRCIPQVKIHDSPYLISITLDSERKIESFACNCTAGAGTAFDENGEDGYKACKHVCALAVYINQEREESVTDSACGWAAPSQRAKELYGSKGKRLRDIFELKSPEFKHDWSKSPSEQEKENYAKLMKKHGLQDSVLYKVCQVKVRSRKYNVM